MHLSMLSWSSLTSTSHNILSKSLAAFPHNHCLNNGQQGQKMNPVTVTTINARREYWPSQRSNQLPAVLKSRMLPTELWGLAFFWKCIVSPPHNPDLATLEEKHFKKLVVSSIFSFSHTVFYSSQHNFQFLSHYYFVVCKCFEFGHGQNFVVWQELTIATNF